MTAGSAHGPRAPPPVPETFSLKAMRFRHRPQKTRNGAFGRPSIRAAAHRSSVCRRLWLCTTIRRSRRKRGSRRTIALAATAMPGSPACTAAAGKHLPKNAASRLPFCTQQKNPAGTPSVNRTPAGLPCSHRSVYPFASSLPSRARAKSCGSKGRRSSIFSPRPMNVMGSSN